MINSAMGDLLPAGAAQAMGYVAEQVAIDKDNLDEGTTFICPTCGYVSRDLRPVKCGVCGNEATLPVGLRALQRETSHVSASLPFKGSIDGLSRIHSSNSSDIAPTVFGPKRRKRGISPDFCQRHTVDGETPRRSQISDIRTTRGDVSSFMLASS